MSAIPNYLEYEAFMTEQRKFKAGQLVKYTADESALCGKYATVAGYKGGNVQLQFHDPAAQAHVDSYAGAPPLWTVGEYAIKAMEPFKAGDRVQCVKAEPFYGDWALKLKGVIDGPVGHDSFMVKLDSTDPIPKGSYRHDGKWYARANEWAPEVPQAPESPGCITASWFDVHKFAVAPEPEAEESKTTKQLLNELYHDRARLERKLKRAGRLMNDVVDGLQEETPGKDKAWLKRWGGIMGQLVEFAEDVE